MIMKAREKPELFNLPQLQIAGPPEKVEEMRRKTKEEIIPK